MSREAAPHPQTAASGSLGLVELLPPGAPSRLASVGGANEGSRQDLSQARWLLRGGDLARSEEILVWILGHLRRPGGRRLSAREVLDARLVTTETVDTSRLTGNGLVLALSTLPGCAPRFLAYSTLFSMPQLYLARGDDGAIRLATDLRALVPLLDRAEIDEDAVPLHFLFRFVPGRGTYLRGVERLFPGERWRGSPGAPLERRRLVDLSFPESSGRAEGLTEEALATLDRCSSRVVGSYLEGFRADGRPAGNLLSGGIDSSLLQAWIGDHPDRERNGSARSFGFAVPEAPSFGFETDYARDASHRLGTHHTFVEIGRDDYPDLLRRAIGAILQPELFNEGWACHVALAERLGAERWSLFAGNGADAVHGILDLIEVERARRLGRVPGLGPLLRAAAPLVRPFPGLQRAAEPWIDAARVGADPATLRSPTDRVSIAGELDDALRAFGPSALRRAFDVRRALADEFLPAAVGNERLQVLDLVTAGYDPTVAVTQIYAAAGVEVVQPYLDEELLRAAFAFDPAVRFFAGPRPNAAGLKPLQRRLLERRGFADLAAKPKGGTTFYREVWNWMSRGVLRPLVDAIDRPSFLSRRHFADLVERPGDFLWNLLVFDLFRSELAALRRQGHRTPDGST